MVDADAAGVMFTANPANGRRDEAGRQRGVGAGRGRGGRLVDTDDLVVDARPARGARAAGPPTRPCRPFADRAAPRRCRYRRTVAARRCSTTPPRSSWPRWALRIQEHFGAPAGHRVGACADGRSRSCRPGRSPRCPRPRPTRRPTGPCPTQVLYVRASIVEQLPDPLTPAVRRAGRRVGHPVAAGADAASSSAAAWCATTTSGCRRSTATPTTATAAPAWRRLTRAPPGRSGAAAPGPPRRPTAGGSGPTRLRRDDRGRRRTSPRR